MSQNLNLISIASLHVCQQPVYSVISQGTVEASLHRELIPCRICITSIRS